MAPKSILDQVRNAKDGDVIMDAPINSIKDDNLLISDFPRRSSCPNIKTREHHHSGSAQHRLLNRRQYDSNLAFSSEDIRNQGGTCSPLLAINRDSIHSISSSLSRPLTGRMSSNSYSYESIVSLTEKRLLQSNRQKTSHQLVLNGSKTIDRLKSIDNLHTACDTPRTGIFNDVNRRPSDIVKLPYMNKSRESLMVEKELRSEKASLSSSKKSGLENDKIEENNDNENDHEQFNEHAHVHEPNELKLSNVLAHEKIVAPIDDDDEVINEDEEFVEINEDSEVYLKCFNWLKGLKKAQKSGGMSLDDITAPSFTPKN